VLRAGIARENLPGRFGGPNSIYRRYRRWAVAGIWDALFRTGVPEDALETVMIDAGDHQKPALCQRRPRWWQGGTWPVALSSNTDYPSGGSGQLADGEWRGPQQA